MLKNYFKIAWRSLVKNRSASIINITGLSLGMAAAILILLWVQNELNYDNYHPHARNIYYVDMGPRTGQTRFGGTPFQLSETIKKQIPGIEEITRFVGGNGYSSPVLNINEQFFREKTLVFVDKNWFNFFHYDFIGGSALAFNQNPNSIILTESLAKKYYGNKTATGQIIKIDSIDYRVQAVVKDNPSNSSFQYNIFLPEEQYLKTREAMRTDWRYFAFQTFIRTKQNASIPKIEQGISSIIARQEHFSLTNDDRKEIFAGYITPLKKIHFEGGYFAKTGDKKIVTIFSVLGFLLLVIASINYVNLSTARASKRSKEVSIKKIMGANTKSLFSQFMIESLLTSVIALLLTLVLVKLGLPWFNKLTEKTFTLSLSSGALWQVMAGTLLITILLTGIYPALLLSSFKPLNVLKGNNILKIKDGSLRKTLVTTQFTIAIALSVCTIVILQQLHFIQNNNEGYNRSQIFSFPIPNSWASTGYATDNTDFVKTFKNELQQETSIENITVSNEAIQNISMSMGGIADWIGKKPGEAPLITLLSVDADFRKIFNLQLLEGRWYDAGNATDKHNYILTETTVAMLGLKKPFVGQYFSIMNDTGIIIGVAKDFHFRNYHQKIDAAVLTSRADMKGTLFVQSAPFKMKQALAKTTSAWKRFFPRIPFEYKFMDEEFEKMYRADTKTATLISIFAGIAIFISCLGLLGLVSFVAEQRTKEIGIRKILGATVTNIAALLSKDFMKLVLLAIIIASPVAWWAASKWLQTFAYRINITWWMFVIAGMAAIIIALITVSFQAIKAAIVNPAKSLRTE